MIASAYPPENVIGALRPARFARYLPQFGFRPIVITSSEQKGGVRDVHHVPFHNSLPARILGLTLIPGDERITWVPATAALGERLIREHKIRAVFSTSPPLGTHVAAAQLKARTGIRWIADFRDPLVGNQSRFHFMNRLDPLWERYLAKRMDLAILNTDILAERWRARYPFLKDRIHYLLNGFDPNDPMGPLPLPQRSHQLWLHAGTIYFPRYPERLLASISRLHKENRFPTPVQLRLLGEVDGAVLGNPLVRELTEAGVLDCHPNPVPQPEARREMAEAAGLVVFDHYYSSGNVSIPAKIYDYVRIGRPILAFSSPGAPLDRLLSRCGIANTVIYDEDPPPVIDRKVLEFTALPREAREPSEYFRKDFSALEQTRQLAEMLRSLL